jgi:predicted MPP superfamily phosphohydrolase
MNEMNAGMPFSPVTLELISSAYRVLVLALAVLAQIYLFVRFREAIRSTRLSRRAASWAVGAAGLVIVTLFSLSGLVLARPLAWLDPPPALQAVLFYMPSLWSVGSLTCALILLASRCAGELGRRAAKLWRDATGRAPSPPVDTGRRRFVKAGVGALAATPFVLSGYGAAYAGRSYTVEELSVPFGLPLRVVQLTDIHAGLTMTRREMRRYADEVISLEPDLFVLTGDYVTNTSAFLPDCLEEMARVRSRYGTFAVLGNHDHWYVRNAELEALFRQSGIPLLRNASRVIETVQGPFAVAGIDDLNAGRPDLRAALQGLAPAVPTILLSHRPEVFPEAASRGVALTLAGHYHGGQIKLVLPNRQISVAHLRTPYPEGLFRIGESRLYVSRGIGTSLTPVRLNARPEITLLNLA